MPIFEQRTRLDVPAAEAFAWHERPGAFERLTPPGSSLRTVSVSGGIRDGAHRVMRLGRGPLRFHWVAVHSGYEEGRQFRDEQVYGAFARWVHTHRFEPLGEAACEYVDHVDYRLPLGLLGARLAGPGTERTLRRLFAFRHARVRNDLARHAALSDRGALRIAISGASGLVGSALAPFLTSGGHEVLRLVRREPEGEAELRWDPARDEVDARALEGVDAVVHLAGESIAGRRWSPARKAAIRASRIESTHLLASTLAGLERKPRVLVNASAVGFYGDRGDERLDEKSSLGSGFLAEVCREWEAATWPAEQAGIRVVKLRIGIVLSPAGGVLAIMLRPGRLGLGGHLGSGRQFMPWIALDDLVGVIQHALFEEGLSGPVNAVAPEPAANAEVVRALGRVLRRPAWLAVPAALLRLAMGRELADQTALASTRAQPTRLLSSGFQFLYPELESALRAELGR
jgi:uncharacterized protein (TIGR01777 family)